MSRANCAEASGVAGTGTGTRTLAEMDVTPVGFGGETRDQTPGIMDRGKNQRVEHGERTNDSKGMTADRHTNL